MKEFKEEKVNIYPLDTLTNNFKTIYIRTKGTTINEVTGLKLIAEIYDEEIRMHYNVSCYNVNFDVRADEIELYPSLEDFKCGNKISKVNVLVKTLIERTERMEKVFAHQSANGTYLFAIKLTDKGSEVVIFDVNGLTIDYFSNKYCNVTADADFGDNKEYLYRAQDAVYFHNYKVIDKDGNMVEQKPIVDRFRLNEEQTKLVEEFNAIVKKMKENKIALVYDNDSYEYTAIADNGDWDIHYEEPDEHYGEVRLNALRNVCPSLELNPRWYGCEDMIYIKTK